MNHYWAFIFMVTGLSSSTSPIIDLRGSQKYVIGMAYRANCVSVTPEQIIIDGYFTIDDVRITPELGETFVMGGVMTLRIFRLTSNHNGTMLVCHANTTRSNEIHDSQSITLLALETNNVLSEISVTPTPNIHPSPTVDTYHSSQEPDKKSLLGHVEATRHVELTQTSSTMHTKAQSNNNLFLIMLLFIVPVLFVIFGVTGCLIKKYYSTMKFGFQPKTVATDGANSYAGIKDNREHNIQMEGTLKDGATFSSNEEDCIVPVDDDGSSLAGKVGSISEGSELLPKTVQKMEESKSLNMASRNCECDEMVHKDQIVYNKPSTPKNQDTQFEFLKPKQTVSESNTSSESLDIVKPEEMSGHGNGTVLEHSLLIRRSSSLPRSIASREVDVDKMSINPTPSTTQNLGNHHSPTSVDNELDKCKDRMPVHHCDAQISMENGVTASNSCYEPDYT